MDPGIVLPVDTGQTEPGLSSFGALSMTETF